MVRHIRRGDIYFCRGSPGAIGSEERKERPVVVVQNNIGNLHSPTVIVAPLTSNVSRYRYPMRSMWIYRIGSTPGSCAIKSWRWIRADYSIRSTRSMAGSSGNWINA